MKSIFDLIGKVALVTGAGRGIGRILAEGLANAGAEVVLLARTEDEVKGSALDLPAIGLNQGNKSTIILSSKPPHDNNFTLLQFDRQPSLFLFAKV